MRRRVLGLSAGGLVLAGATVSRLDAAEGKGHRIVLHVGSNDPASMRVALNNISAAQQAYAELGEPLRMELVANGGGYTMLRADTSPVRDRLAEIHRLYPAVVFSACQSTRRGLAEAEHKAVSDIPEVPEATDVPAGIVRITELQELGWTYIRV